VTSKTRRQAYVLVGLVAVLAIVLYVSLRDGDSSASVTSQAGRSTASSNEAVNNGGRNRIPVTDLKLEALQHEAAPLAASERNPFRFKPKAPPPAPRPVAPPPPTYVPPAVTGPPPPPPIPLRYVGLLGSATQADRVAVLSDARGNPFYGKEGDIIEGRYRVLRIAADSVDVAYADGRGRQTLRLSSQ
jgi:hypothetical protein